ncbi:MULTISPECIES: NADP-dependent phosphogluconate dehydrogenase [Pacificibacter]|uniref:NADP-dependent phosphogluconate dehydrogenase n=1 Tax=Pacificibacter TaxID=1042323 RepID=UPI001C08304B|nr:MULTISPECIES: NADP-dependent phosphogluconate dehydrogenase [Pacificibacter]MBU2934829.1 NADP-dependent phosphogluconate dehydrogenase [Pacificibacter marinus]MDO6615803.1 NADP-dependent phosphogluconate dehydrogenase [Pacificibacter sp. 1_MG-2023]
MAQARIGLIGLGVMGANLALNIAENGFPVAVYNRTGSVTDDYIASAGDLAKNLVPTKTLEELVASLTKPRAIIIMVQAGGPVDSVIEGLTPLLDKGDMIIDAGNANFHDTRRRDAALSTSGLNFIGMGVSGGEEGARHGPSIMAGGDKSSFEVIRDILEAISAKHDGAPCADHFGPDGAGHFVKTVHNGIEYADMQMIAEVYGLLRDGEGRSAADIGKLFETWDQGQLKSYLVEISGKVLQTVDEKSGQPIVDIIVDKAGQKGTGRWTAIEALSLGQSPSTIEAAVAARSWSAVKDTRIAGEELFAGLEMDTAAAPAISNDDLEKALLAAKIIAYDQGLNLLSAASDEYNWDLDLASCAEVWREGCIIRSTMLDEMATAAREGLPHGNLIFSPRFADRIKEGSSALRRVVASATLSGQPVPAFAAALAYFDTMRQGRGTTDLVQGQRDFFGAHGFVRVDTGETDQHGPWASDIAHS